MIILVFIAGLLLGSLLNIMIIRLPHERRLLGWPRCTRTGEPLAWWQLLPVLGWALQRGRARDGRRLNWLYPLIELLTAVLLALLYYRYGFGTLFFYLAFVCAVLIVTGAIDWLYRYIYTFVILGAALLALLFSSMVLHPQPLLALLLSLLGAIIGGVVFIMFYFLGRVLFPSASVPFGMGDVYLAIFIGAAVGFNNLGPTLFYGIMLAGVVSVFIVAGKLLRLPNMPTYMSYGTYLCIGAILYVVTRRI